MKLKKVYDCEYFSLHTGKRVCKEFNRNNPNCTNACPFYEPMGPTPLIRKELAAGEKLAQALKTYLKEKGE